MNSLTFRDGFYLFCIVTNILISFILHITIRTFISNKPEGRKTVIAKIHISCSYVWQFITTFIPLIMFFRILTGTFSLEYLIMIQVSIHACFNTSICLFMSTSIIKMFFLVDYGRMSNIGENIITTLVYSITGGWIVGGILIETCWKYLNLSIFPETTIQMYLGNQNSWGKVPDFRYFTIFTFSLLVLSILMLFIFKIARFGFFI